MRVVAAAFLLLAVSASAHAQTAPASPADEALAVVKQLFDAMRAQDTAAIRATFEPGARLVTTRTREGQPQVRVSTLDEFVNAIGGATGTLDELIFEPEIRVDDNLATVWTRYNFYFNGQLSHCGVDAFQLARTTAGWRIIAIADTQRREACEPRKL